MSNLAVVEALYAAFSKGDMPAALATMAPDIVWSEAENYPYADRNPYVGPEAVLHGVFARIGGDWENFTVKSKERLESGDAVISFGRYTGVHKGTGKPMDAQFVHVFRVKNGKIASFQQYADTLGTAIAMGR